MKTKIVFGLILITGCLQYMPHGWALTSKEGAPLHVVLVDQLRPDGDVVINGLEDNRRMILWKEVVLETWKVARPGQKIVLYEDKGPKGATPVLRLYLTRWNLSRLGGPSAQDIEFRVFAELERTPGQTENLGAFTSRENSLASNRSTARESYAEYKRAAKVAVKKLADRI
jgi:hypothetical protein